MDVREKLVELIRCANYHPCKGAVRTIGSMFTTEFIEDIASHLIAHGVTVQEWISVKDRLPEKEGDYMIYATVPFNGRNFMAVMRYEKDAYLPIWSDITHWMPLPEPPNQ